MRLGVVEPVGRDDISKGGDVYLDCLSVPVAELRGSPALLEYRIAARYGVVPVERGGAGYVVLVTCRDQDLSSYARLRFLLNREVLFHVVGDEEFGRLVERTWSAAERSTASVGEVSSSYRAAVRSDARGGSSGGASAGLLEGCDGEGTIEQVDGILSRAVTMGASDIHFEPRENDLQVRFRMDGVLQPVHSAPKARQEEILSRLKILAGMDIAEKRRPQDGRIEVHGDDKAVDVRVSSMRTPHGEKIVLRLLDKSKQPLDLRALGMQGRNLRLFDEAIRRPFGMILVTGPTGSGKTTTLYAALQTILNPEINISTVEDPIEYQIEGINQTQMHADIGYTFAAAVRTFLRQDPDVIMIGEIRDTETAKYAVQAAQTGHLVFSTLHTNDAPSAVVRLLEMGLEPFLVASTVHLIMAQRLVRRTCRSCGAPRPPTPDEERYLRTESVCPEVIFEAHGCKECAQSGYRGRMGVYEIMPVTPEIQDLVAERVSTQKIRECALRQGMRSLRGDALTRVAESITTVAEVRQVVG
ncbi:MAG: type II secretion system protein GspE [Chitinivibrionales bacterium]|nr:type II secretion system protein GspE [Chitinivibrionales bacterium]